jgi:hypothetical protein
VVEVGLAMGRGSGAGVSRHTSGISGLAQQAGARILGTSAAESDESPWLGAVPR